MFNTLLIHLLNLLGMAVIIAVFLIIIAFIGSFTYVMIKHFINAARKTMKDSEENKDESNT